MTVLDSQKIQETDARASSLMKEGIGLLYSSNDAEAALVCFDRALELRLRLPAEVPAHAYRLAACWLNRAEALPRLGPEYHALTLGAYDEALALLRRLPLTDDVRFARRFAIAQQNRALILASKQPPARSEAIAALLDGIAIIGQAEAMNAYERDYILAVAWMNLANIRVAGDATLPDAATAQDEARRALALVQPYEREDFAAAEVSIKARHVLCHIAARRLSERSRDEPLVEDVHDATDLAEEGLDLAREWERRGVDSFRDMAFDLFHFGARVYAHYQPQFLCEFLGERC
jgi:hypothetical protein